MVRTAVAALLGLALSAAGAPITKVQPGSLELEDSENTVQDALKLEARAAAENATDSKDAIADDKEAKELLQQAGKEAADAFGKAVEGVYSAGPKAANATKGKLATKGKMALLQGSHKAPHSSWRMLTRLAMDIRGTQPARPKPIALPTAALVRFIQSKKQAPVGMKVEAVSPLSKLEGSVDLPSSVLDGPLGSWVNIEAKPNANLLQSKNGASKPAVDYTGGLKPSVDYAAFLK